MMEKRKHYGPTTFLVVLTLLLAFSGCQSGQTDRDKDGTPFSFGALDFSVDYRPGTLDKYGRFMGGTEIMRLIVHNGQIFATVGYWTDVPGNDPYPGAQVLRRDSASSDWVVDVTFGSRYLRTEGIISATFTTDSSGQVLATPVNLLIAGPSDINPQGTRWATAWTRNGSNGLWSKSMIVSEPGQAGVRALATHVDRITGIHHIFTGVSHGEIYRGGYEPEAPGSLIWNQRPELSGTGRVMCFAECNGDLYAAAGLELESGSSQVRGGLFRRQDGPEPVWQLVYSWPYVPGSGDESRIMRGLTAVPDPGGGGYDVLIASRSYPGVIERIDPRRDHQVTVELDIRAYFARAWNVSEYKGPALSAYNRFVPALDPDSGARVHLVSLWVEHPDFQTPPNNGSHFLVRHGDASYDHADIFDWQHIPTAGQRLRACRTICPSPFAADGGRAFYFAGYDCAGDPSHNTAWIIKGE